MFQMNKCIKLNWYSSKKNFLMLLVTKGKFLFKLQCRQIIFLHWIFFDILLHVSKIQLWHQMKKEKKGAPGWSCGIFTL